MVYDIDVTFRIEGQDAEDAEDMLRASILARLEGAADEIAEEMGPFDVRIVETREVS